MSPQGTSRYDSIDPALLPPLVQLAVQTAKAMHFEFSVHPATGRLLQSLAAGIPAGGLVAEAGTGTGVGLAWMVSMANPLVEFVSAEIDADRATAAQELFADAPNVRIVHGDCGEVFDRGPFDLLVLDGGWGAGKGPAGSRAPVAVKEVLKEGGLVTVDDFGPMAAWPPMFDGAIDTARTHWLTHPHLLATEIRVAPDMAVVVGRRTTKDSGSEYRQR